MNVQHQQLLTISIILLTTHIISSFTQSVDDTIHDTIYDGCGDYKECFGHGYSDDCVGSRDCLCVGTVYKKGSEFIFEMKSQMGNGYVASGLSTDGRMGDDSVVECVKDGNDVKINMSYTGLFDVSRDGVPQDTAKLLNSYIINNTIYCRIARPAVSQIRGLQFDLNRSDYYVMFVTGSVKSDLSLDYHNVKIYSATAVKFPTLKNTENKTKIRSKRSSSDPIYNDCRNDRQYRCFGLEIDCEIWENCTAMAIISQQDYIHTFQLVSFIGHKFVAFGLSDSKRMETGDLVFECVNYEGKKSAYFSKYNLRNPSRLVERQSPDDQKMMTLADNKLIDKRLYCRINYDNAHSNTKISFDYRQWYFLLSAGNEVEDGFIKNAHFNRVSNTPLRLWEHKKITKPSRVLLQLHGSIMIIAWLGCCALSTLFPMHYRRCFRTWSLFRKDVWFAMHLILNYSTVILCAIGFAIVLYDRGGFVDPKPHWIFAIFAMVFCVGQFVYGYLRPRPLTTAREYFKLFHWFGANMTLMFATAAVFFAIPEPKSELPRKSAWYFLIFVINFVATHASLFLVAYYQKRLLYKPSPLSELDEVPNDQMTPEQKKYYRFQTIRTVILWTFITTTIILISGALWLIWRNEE